MDRLASQEGFCSIELVS